MDPINEVSSIKYVCSSKSKNQNILSIHVIETVLNWYRTKLTNLHTNTHTWRSISAHISIWSLYCKQ